YTVAPTPVITITVADNIKLTSDKNIDWASYILIKSDENKVEVTDDMVTLVSGDSSVSGECEYEVNYQGQKKSFTVIFDYSQVSTSLTASQKLTWNRAVAKDYSNMTVLDQVLEHDFYVTPTMTRCDINNVSYFMQPKNNGYEIYRDGSWVTATEKEMSEYLISFDFSKVDTALLTYDETYAVYVYHSSDLSFCPYFTSLNDYFEEVWFGVYDDNYISYIGFVEGEEVYQCVLYDFGTTDPGTPSDQPIITPDETLGDLQAKENGASVEVFGIVVGKTTKGILIKDLYVDEYVYVYKNGTVNVNIGASVGVSGTIAEFGGAKQISNPTIDVIEATGTVDFNPTPATGSDITAYASNVIVGVPVSVTGTLSVSGNYYNFNVSGTSIVVSICYPEQDIKSYNGQEITINGYLIYLSGSKTKYANIVLVSLGEEQPQPDETVTELTDEQLAAWNESLALDYSQYTLTDSVNSYMENIDHSLYYFVSFDEDAYTCIDYY
ncbi:MAG: hypothetical protein K2O05_04130, partial [Anaeroplasmataceae bacterium]|nr:hypothetical protein [Anaeroplasmataceae bacterium]